MLSEVGGPAVPQKAVEPSLQRAFTPDRDPLIAPNTREELGVLLSDHHFCGVPPQPTWRRMLAGSGAVNVRV